MPQLYTQLLEPMGIRAMPATIESAIEAFVARRNALEHQFGVSVDRALESECARESFALSTSDRWPDAMGDKVIAGRWELPRRRRYERGSPRTSRRRHEVTRSEGGDGPDL